MIIPENVSFMAKVFVSISGITLLYICQNAQIERNAKPIRIVCLVFSFIVKTPFFKKIYRITPNHTPVNSF